MLDLLGYSSTPSLLSIALCCVAGRSLYKRHSSKLRNMVIPISACYLVVGVPCFRKAERDARLRVHTIFTRYININTRYSVLVHCTRIARRSPSIDTIVYWYQVPGTRYDLLLPGIIV